MNQTLPTYLVSARERPLLGRIAFSRRDFKRLLEDLRGAVQKMREQGGGLLLVPHSREQEPSVTVLLHMLASAVRKDRPEEAVHLIRPDQASSNLKEELATGTLIVPHLPRFSGLLDFLEGEGLDQRVVVASGLNSEYKQLPLSLPHQLAPSLPALSSWDTDEIVEDLARQVEALPDFHRRLFLLVAAWDTCEITLPLNLLARALEVEKAEAGGGVERLQNEGLLFWVEGRSSRDLRVATGSSVLAREVFRHANGLEENGRNEAQRSFFERVLRALDAEDEPERHVALQLFQTAATPSGTRLIDSEQVVGLEELPVFEQIWEKADAAESVLWGRALARPPLFEKADAVLDAAISHHRGNAHLLHARAQTLADRVQINASLAPQAEEAFKEVANEAPGNCYVYQSWAAMRAKAGGDPVPLFERARRAADTPSERAAVLVAWADYEAERGNYEAAEDHLNPAEEAAPQNPYVPHVRGKIAFLRGEYEDAEKHFLEVRDHDLHSVVALNALGHMARVRGDYEVAQEHLQTAHDLDPENVPTLHELGNLWSDIADEEQDEGSQAAEDARPEALDWYKQALAREAENVQVLVSSANALLPLAAGDAGDDRKALRKKLNKVLNDLSPGNARALHVFGRFHQEVARRADQPQQAGKQRAEARDYFDQILDDDPRNLAALRSLADLHADAGDEEAARSTLDVLGRALNQHEKLTIPAHERVRALNAWAGVEDRFGNTERAVELAEEAEEIDDGNRYTQRLLRRLRRGRA
jgi:tetratricopeptide (TPR) repeat protein